MAQNSFVVRYQYSGTDELLRQLQGIDLMTQEAVLVEALTEASKPIVEDARANITSNGSVRTGALRKAVGFVIRRYPRMGRLVAYIGVRHMDFAATETGGSALITAKRRLGPGETLVTPANYAHLVEFGHRSVHGGGALPNYGEKVGGVWNSQNKGKSLRHQNLQTTSVIPPKPFLRPAFDRNIFGAELKLRDGFAKALEKIFNRRSQSLDKKVLKLAA